MIGSSGSLHSALQQRPTRPSSPRCEYRDRTERLKANRCRRTPPHQRNSCEANAYAY
ncbi:hypothetical protein [Nostoc sp.]|uniref:hypothetical protein n=1 Tax=Nostoc sp. TaxID=1180 RepID=UPI002FFC19B7